MDSRWIGQPCGRSYFLGSINPVCIKRCIGCRRNQPGFEIFALLFQSPFVRGSCALPGEAYPEGSQRHLSAESGLYCRIFTEGLFGIRPTGLHSFSFTPRLPDSWSVMSLRHIHAFEKDFDIRVERVNGKLMVLISDQEKIWLSRFISEGEMVIVNLEQ